MPANETPLYYHGSSEFAPEVIRAGTGAWVPIIIMLPPPHFASSDRVTTGIVT
jgi:hypothetical protein